MLAVDIGGATTDVFTAEDGEVFRTVSANLGLSYSILNVAALVGPERIAGWLGQRCRTGRTLEPHRQQAHPPDPPARDTLAMRVEWAVATGAIREAVRAHYEVLRGAPPPPTLKGPRDVNELLKGRPKQAPAQPPRPPEEYELIIGSGGILSHSPRDAAARVLVDALQPGPGRRTRARQRVHLPAHRRASPSRTRRSPLELLRKLGMVKAGRVGSRVLRIPGRVRARRRGRGSRGAAGPARQGPSVLSA